MRKASWNLKLSDWDTWCGWHFSEKNVKASLAPKFLQGSNKCKKRESAYEARDAVKGGISLAQLMAFGDTAPADGLDGLDD